jgi:hypothetical protein
MKRDRRMQETTREGGTALADLPEMKALAERLEAPPPERETIPFTTRGPRRREPGEAAATYDGPNIRVTLDGDTWMIDAKKSLTMAQQDRIVAAGFDDVSEAQDGSLWLAQKWAVAKTGTDMNVLSIVLDGKGERLGRSR